jgi:hypothetical protein
MGLSAMSVEQHCHAALGSVQQHCHASLLKYAVVDEPSRCVHADDAMGLTACRKDGCAKLASLHLRASLLMSSVVAGTLTCALAAAALERLICQVGGNVVTRAES